MKKRSITNLVIIIVFCFTSQYPQLVWSSDTDHQSESELKWLLEQMKEREKTLTSLAANFMQTKKTRLLREPLQSKGQIYYDSTGKMLFKVTSPSSVLVLIKNGLILTYYPDLSRAEERYFGSNIIRRYFGIGMSIDELREQYKIELVSKTPGNGYRLKLTPVTETIAKRIDTIEIEIKPIQWLPEYIFFKEKGGDSTAIHLQFTSINKPLPENIFTITIPKDQREEL
ncbi:MAG: outer membrane lipoprotein carrier protein LolA [Deltaproteobacteria bacterium]|nr:outer membrane lipoprotein carrier protein LolA [Deltaproteobacteria bacterium]